MKNNNISLLIIPFLILVIGHIIMGLYMEVPVVAPDEFSYLALAQYFTGTDMPFVPNGGLIGGFGYSLLISPAFLFNSGPVGAYQTAIVINSILASGIYIGLFLMLRVLFNSKPSQAAITSFITSLYPAFMLQSNMAWSDAILPTIYVFNILSFIYLIKRRTIFYSIVLSLITSYFLSVDVRALPIIPIAIVTLGYLVYRKRLPAVVGIVPIILIAVFTTLTLIYSNVLANMIAGRGAFGSNIQNHISLIYDLLLFAMFVLGTSWLIKKKKWAMLAGFVSGWIFGVLSSISLFFIFLPVATLIYTLLVNQGKENIKPVSWQVILITISGAFLAYILFPELNYVKDNFTILVTWSTNLLSRVFYLSFSTWGIFLLGFLGIFVFVWNNRNKYKGAYSDEAIALMFLFATAVGIFATTIPIIKSLDSIRPDLLFYGRYVEVFLAPFLAMGIYGFIEDTEIENGFFRIFTSLVVMIISAFGIIALYGNFIDSEPSFRNFLSFFAPRAVFGTIDILIYLGIMLLALIIISILFSKNFNFGGIVLTLAFLSFSIFTYRYVIQYHQFEKQKITNIINTLYDIPDVKSAVCMAGNKSPDTYMYKYRLPGIHIHYKGNSSFKNSFQKKRNENMMISEDYMLSNHLKFPDCGNYFPLDIEYGGNSILWAANSTAEKNNTQIPCYIGLNLLDNNIVGVVKKGFFSDNVNGKGWINGTALIKMPMKANENYTTFKFSVNNNSGSPKNLKIICSGIELFNKQIPCDTNIYKIHLPDSIDVKKCDGLKFYSGLEREIEKPNKLKGLQLISAMVLGSANENNRLEVDEPGSGFDYDLKIASNYNFFKAGKKAGDIMKVPLIITNTGSETIDLANNDISVSVSWYDYILENNFKTIGLKGHKKIIEPGYFARLIIHLPVVNTPGRYFLDIGLAKNGKYVNSKSNRCHRMMVVVD